MTLFEIYYCVSVVICWIAVLVYVELDKDGDFSYMYECEDVYLIFITHVLIITIAMVLPLFWPVIVIYFLIRYIVKSLSKIIKMKGSKKNNDKN